jgi:hypothetical protein
LAFPNASKTGLHPRILSSIGISPVYNLLPEDNDVSNYIANLAFSVFPAPDSPDITIAYEYHIN